MRTIIYYLSIMIIMTSCKFNKTLIGTIEDDGNYYRSYNDLFIVKNLNRDQYPDFFFNDIYVADCIDEEGYKFEYSFISEDIIDKIIIYRNQITPEQFKTLLYERVEALGDSLNTVYTNISNIKEFTCYAYSIQIVDTSNSNEEKNKTNLDVLFCYHDSLQLEISSLIRNSRFGDEDRWELGGRGSERELSFILSNNLVMNDKIYDEGIPEPLTEGELKEIYERK